MLMELRQDRDFAIKSSIAESKRSEAKVLAAKKTLDAVGETISGKLRALCDIEEQDARMAIAQPCYDAAQHELSFIDYLIEQIKPLCDMSDPALFQKIQAPENALDLLMRAYTSIIIYNNVSPEIVNEARNSPYRQQVIAAIVNVQQRYQAAAQEGIISLMEFQSLPKEKVLDELAATLGVRLLTVNTIQYPEQEALPCTTFPKQLIVSTSPAKTLEHEA